MAMYNHSIKVPFRPTQDQLQLLLDPNSLSMMKSLHHNHTLAPHQCGSVMVQTIDAPLPLVWSMVRRFDKPQDYKGFIRSCTMTKGDGAVGSVRQLILVSGLPAGTSTERLDVLDDCLHVTGFSVIGGDHRLMNYRSTTTVHRDGPEKGGKTVVIESYVVDVPQGCNHEDTCVFAETIIGCNLKSLAIIAERNAYRV